MANFTYREISEENRKLRLLIVKRTDQLTEANKLIEDTITRLTADERVIPELQHYLDRFREGE